MANRNLSEGQFRYETRVKDKPNSQGTLFQVSPEARTPESRQPRGYSPERYKAVTEATDISRRDTGPKSYKGHAHGGMAMSVYKGHAETLARAAASLARSTVPLSDIARPHPDQRLSESNIGLHIGVTPSNGGNDPLGEYTRPEDTANRDSGWISLYNKKAHDGTVIHEIGHHVDRANPYKTPADQGRAEGFAEAYQQEHARTAGYKKKRVKVESDPSKWEGFNSRNISPHQFDNAFYSQHPRTSGPKINSKEEILSRPGIPKGHVIGQIPLLNTTASWDSMKGDYVNRRWTYNEDLNK